MVRPSAPGLLATALSDARARVQDDEGAKTATVGSYVSGVICALGWYVWMAVCLLPSVDPNKYEWDCKNISTDAEYIVPCEHKAGAYWAPGILMTIAIIMLNVISWEAISDDGLEEGCGVAAKAKCWVGFTFVTMFCSLGGSLWILIQDATNQGKENKGGDRLWMGPAAGVMVQCICLFIGGLTFRVVRRKGDHSI